MIAMAAAKYQWWQLWGNTAQICSALIALLGFCAVLLQLNEIRSNNYATAARQVYLAYADLEFKNPQFSDPDYAQIKAAGKETLGRYKSFVAYLLYACGEVIFAFPKEPEWRNSCEYDVKRHLPFLCETGASDPAFLATFGDLMQNFVKTLMTKASMSAPECKAKPA
jgi:hypothetical protein